MTTLFTFPLGIKRMQYLDYSVDRLKKGFHGKLMSISVFNFIPAC